MALGDGDSVALAGELRVGVYTDLGIPRDRASRAMKLADVPRDQFDAALEQLKTASCVTVGGSSDSIAALNSCPGIEGTRRAVTFWRSLKPASVADCDLVPPPI